MHLTPFSFSKRFTDDPSLGSLLAVNLLIATGAVALDWNLFILLWTYWLQSVIVGVFHVIRLIMIRNFKIEGSFTINGRSAKNIKPQTLKRKIIPFFIVHYGGFHFGYFIFLSILSFVGGENADQFIELVMSRWAIFFNGLLFAVHYGFNLFYYKDQYAVTPKIASMLFEPYLRIIPMHLTIMLYFFISIKHQVIPVQYSSLVLLLFLLLKIFVDAIMHIRTQKKIAIRLNMWRKDP